MFKLPIANYYLQGSTVCSKLSCTSPLYKVHMEYGNTSRSVWQYVDLYKQETRYVYKLPVP